MRDIVVITPVGRQEHYLTDAAASMEAFRSAAAQHVRIRWALVSDGPDDGWVSDAARAFRGEQVTFPPLAERQGPARTRNRALAAVEPTDLVMSLDSDDTWISAEAAVFVSDFITRWGPQGAKWAAGRTLDIDDSGRLVSIGPAIALAEGPQPPDVVRTHALAHGYVPFHACATITEAAVVREVGGRDTSATFTRGEDIAMWARIARARHGIFTHRPVLQYRQHDSSLTASRSWRTPTEAVNALARQLDDPEPSSGSFATDLALMTSPRHTAPEPHP